MSDYEKLSGEIIFYNSVKWMWQIRICHDFWESSIKGSDVW